jgi:hypothetical protein
VEISESLLPATQTRADLEIIGELRDMEFDEDGNLKE